jgi:hypothetical protein
MSDKYLLIAKAVKVTTTKPPVIVVEHSKTKQNKTKQQLKHTGMCPVNNDLSG